MPHLRLSFLLFPFISACLWLHLGSGLVFAKQLDLLPSLARTASGPPPWPFSGPQPLPSLTSGYHQHTDFPVSDEKWIDVDLSEQRVVAYDEGNVPVRAFIVSTGLRATPTVQGEFRMWVKTRAQTMYGGSRAAGNYYYLPNVEWVQYFYEDYSFHGTYWHNNFGQPMSHGCINMTNEDAQWLFEWTAPVWDLQGDPWQAPLPEQPGTLVVVHE